LRLTTSNFISKLNTCGYNCYVHGRICWRSLWENISDVTIANRIWESPAWNRFTISLILDSLIVL
jgi:hypothetical protein